MTPVPGSVPAPAPGPARVVWHRIVLRGFGPFRDEVRVEFPDGLTTLVAPNEFGKSTLVAGLAAVIFGLPASSDPTAFGQARFRHWGGPGRFEGEAEFTAADGQRYLVWRNFDGHRVRLVRLGSAPVVVFDSTQNPKARRRSITYESYLQGLIGIASRELFIQTFCIEQPLPEMPKLPAQIQSLLSGAGGGTYQAALGSLFEKLRAITKRKGDLGVGDRNDNADRELERLEQEIRDLEQAARNSSHVTDELQQVLRRQSEVNAERAALKADLDQAERAERAWQDWLRLAESYAAQARRRTELKGDLDQATQLARRIQEAQARLAREWPEMEGAPEQTEALLDRLAQLEERLAEARHKRAGLVRELCQARGRAALAIWHRYRTLLARLQELDAELAPYEPLSEADPETIRLLRDFDREQARLRAELDQARAALQQAQERRKSLDEQEDQLRQAFAEVLSMQPEVAAAIDEKIDLLERRDRLDQTEAQVAARLTQQRRAWLTAAGAGTATALVALGGLAAAGVGLAVAAAAAVLLGLVALALALRAVRKPAIGPLPDLKQERARLAADLMRVDRVLGELAVESQARLAELRAQWKQFHAQRDQLDRRKAEAPSDGTIAELQARVDEATGQWQRFESRVRPFVQRYSDPARACQEWERLVRDRASVQHAVEMLCHEEWGATPGDVESLPPDRAGSLWTELGAAARAPTLAALIGWLERFDPAFWSDPDAEQRLWAAAPADPTARLAWLERLGNEALGTARALAGQMSETDGSMADLEAEAAGIRSRLARVLSASGGDAALARRRWQERADHLQALEKDRHSLQTLLKARGVETVEQLAVLADQAADGAVAIRQSLEQLVRANPGLPSTDLLSDLPSATRQFEAVRERANELRAQRRQLDEEYERLRERELQLTGQQPVNIAAAELKLAELRKRRDELWFEAEALALAYKELQATVTAYQASYRQRLEASASRYFAEITGRPGRRVELDEQFHLWVLEPDGTRAAPAQLSKGAQDQLYVALRLAIADLMASDLRLPFIFDDAFLNCDAARLGRIRATLDSVAAGGRQVLLLSHRSEFATWGRPAVSSMDFNGPTSSGRGTRPEANGDPGRTR